MPNLTTTYKNIAFYRCAPPEVFETYISRAVENWAVVLDLRHYDIDIVYKNGKNKNKMATCEMEKNYRAFRLTFWVNNIKELTIKDLNILVVHELLHAQCATFYQAYKPACETMDQQAGDMLFLAMYDAEELFVERMSKALVEEFGAITAF